MSVLKSGTLCRSADSLIDDAIRYTVIDAGPLNCQTDLSGWWYRLVKGLIAVFPQYFELGKLKPEHDSNIEINHMTVEITIASVKLEPLFAKEELEEIEKGLIKRRTSFKWIHKYIATIFPDNSNGIERLLEKLLQVNCEPKSDFILPKLMNIIDLIFDHYGGFKNIDASTKQDISAKIYKTLTLNEKSKWLADLAYECYVERKHISDFYKVIQLRSTKSI